MHSGSQQQPADDALTALLIERGWLSVNGPGLISCAGPFQALCAFFDGAFAALARRRGALPHDYPGIISRQLLERLEYSASFPGVATNVGESHVLSPAVCYHTYAFLEGRELEEHPYRITACGRCCRYEGEQLTHSPRRLWDFTMREIVFFGSDSEVSRERGLLVRTVVRWLPQVGMAGEAVAATDSFFLGPSRGKFLLQKLKQLKHELRAPVGDGTDLAIASFNHHESFFTRRMNIRFADGTPAASGCVAFGIERWSYAFLSQNGLEIEGWPEPVRRFVSRHAVG
jgi:hypothetical protein